MEDATNHPRVKPAGGTRRGPIFTPVALFIFHSAALLMAGFVMGVWYAR